MMALRIRRIPRRIGHTHYKQKRLARAGLRGYPGQTAHLFALHKALDAAATHDDLRAEDPYAQNNTRVFKETRYLYLPPSCPAIGKELGHLSG
jgi:hypothetical protein